ncbi:MAG: SdpI family protein [candidate division Zixibacteria bacterium]|nr:SdpI family protein [candidate division Zixibacteria bacterium]
MYSRSHRLRWRATRKADATTLIPILIGGFFVVLGSVMGKIRPNWFFGIRTPWTLSSKLSWSKTHRLGGWLMILAGVVTMGAGALSPTLAFTVMIAGLIVTMVPLIVYSYIVWRNDPDKFPPAGTAPSEEA